MRTLISSKGLKNFLHAAWNAPANASKRVVCKILYKGPLESLARRGRSPIAFHRAGCIVAGTPVLMAPGTIAQSGRALLVASLPLLAVPIQDVPLLSYALAHSTVNQSYNPIAGNDLYTGLLANDPVTSEEQRQRDAYEINDTDWYEVAMEQVAGISSCRLALHKDWIAEQGYASGAIVEMQLPEQGISGPFRITSIRHILPQKKPEEDPGPDYTWKPVTGLFTHVSDQILEITLDNDETLGVTSAHPVYSTTYDGWRLAGELKIGEQVMTRTGEATITSRAWREGAETVYNLEVKELHNFLVGDVGVVVHNNYGILQTLIDGIYNATKAFHKPYKCQEYSKAIRTYFKSKGKNIKTIRWQVINNNGQDVPTVIGFDMPSGSTINISTNGFHEFTIINDKIFDNNVFNGMPIGEYLNRIQIPPGYGIRQLDIID